MHLSLLLLQNAQQIGILKKRNTTIKITGGETTENRSQNAGKWEVDMRMVTDLTKY